VAAERILGSPAGADDTELRDDLGRLVIDVQHLLPPASELDLLIRSLQRRTRRYRRTTLTRVGRYVVSQLLSRRRSTGAKQARPERQADAPLHGTDARQPETEGRQPGADGT